MNYVFFFADELRAEALHCYGNTITKTPNFDKLAQQGVMFNQCHVQHTVCSPSRCSMITGHYPHVGGHRTLWNLVKPNEKNLFSYLKNAGYDVHIYGKNDMFSPESVPLYTDEFVSYEGLHEPIIPENDFGTDGCYNFLYKPMDDEDEKKTSDYRNVQAGIDFIHKWKPTDRPFIIFLPLSFPHCPYTAPSHYYNMYIEQLDQIKLRPVCENKPQFHHWLQHYRPLTEEDSKRINAVYSGMVSYTDMLLGKLMQCLENTKHIEDTMLIASADHGDYAGDYGLVEKWPSGCEDVLTRVPLIIRSPSCKKGHKINELVELFDIMPTILENENIEITHTHFAQSLIPQLHGMQGDSTRAVYCEGGYNINEPHCSEGGDKKSVQWMDNMNNIYYPKHIQQKVQPKSVCRSVMVRTGTHKFVRRSNGEHELYDLQCDPKELYNIYDKEDYMSTKRDLETNLLDWYLNTSDVVPFEEDPRLLISKQ